MGATVSQSYQAIQDVSNNILQESNQKCINACKNFSEDATIDIQNSNIGGSITLDQTCAVVGDSCNLKSAVDNTIANTLLSQAKQKESGDGGIWAMDFGSYNENINIDQSIRNNVSQILNSQCQQTSTNTAIRPTIYLVNDNVGGSVSLNQSGGVSRSSCIINNTASSSTTNQETAKGDQSFSCLPCPSLGLPGGMLMTFGMVMFGLIFMVAIVAVLYMVYKKKHKHKHPQGGGGPQMGMQPMGGKSMPSLPSMGGKSMPSLPSMGGKSMPSLPSMGGGAMSSLSSMGGGAMSSLSSMGGGGGMGGFLQSLEKNAPAIQSYISKNKGSFSKGLKSMKRR